MSNEGDCLGLEWPANVADLLNEFYVTLWQSEPARGLLWQVRSLSESAERRRTGRISMRALYLFSTLLGNVGCVLF